MSLLGSLKNKVTSKRSCLYFYYCQYLGVYRQQLVKWEILAFIDLLQITVLSMHHVLALLITTRGKLVEY